MNINVIESQAHSGSIDMAATASRRGRPRGTGIDDSEHLREIAAMIAADPALKPTTAIRNLGISDPSVIRRLRDKFNVTRTSLEADLAAGKGEKTASTRPAPGGAQGSLRADNDDHSRTVCLDHTREPRISAVPAMLHPKPARDLREEPGSVQGGPPPAGNDQSPVPAAAPPQGSLLPDTVDVNMLWGDLCATGLKSAAAVFRAQLLLTGGALRSPFVLATMRYQVAFNEMFFAMAAPNGARRTS